MAAASPIILTSSSPNSYQIPPITPPSLQNKSGILISSSPGLVSPSRFVKPRASGLKSGSRAQQVPDGVQVGFASASALWKVKELEKDKERNERKVEEDEQEDVRVEQSKQSRGKLAKPKKAATGSKVTEPRPGVGLDEYAYVDADLDAPKPKVSTKSRSKATKSTKREAVNPNRTDSTAKNPKTRGSVPEKQGLDEYAYKDPRIPEQRKSKEKSVVKSTQDVTEGLPQGLEPTQRQVISLSEFALDAPVRPADFKDKVPETIPKQKKPRKRAAKNVGAPTKAPARKPAKRKMRSESVILNSDDPDDPEPINEPTMASNYFSRERPQESEREHIRTNTKSDGAILDKTEPRMLELNSYRMDCDLSNQQDHEKETRPYIVSKSAYFSPAAANCTSQEATGPAEAPIPDSNALDSLEKANPAPTPVPMLTKRRDWTPVKDSIALDTEQQRPLTADSGDSEPKRQLVDILGGFSYVSDESGPNTVARIATGEAVTKRVRIELGPPVMPGVGVRNEEDTAIQNPSKPAKQKKGRKKAQTITALATAAFQPPKDQTTDEGTISHFFSPSKDCANEEAPKPEQPKAKSTKPRKPRKPKERATVESKDSSTKKKKPTKAKQTKVKFNEADYRSKLYSPGRATAELSRQGFLFGTSSQLAVDEPASFLRDMQNAIQQSEFRVGSKVEGALASSQAPFSQFQQSPQGKSSIRVPTAPHGTCLSIEQARRELWCVSARDPDGAIFKAWDTTVAEACEMEVRKEAYHELGHVEPAPESKAEEVENSDFPELKLDPKGTVVDLCDTSPIAIARTVQPVGPSIETHTVQEQAVKEASLPLPVQETEDADDSMLLSSSSPPPAMQQPTGSVELCGNLSAPQRFDDLVNLSPRRFRIPLSPLNPNIMILNGWSPGKTITSGQVRQLSSSPTDQARQRSPSGRGRGRPRKDAVNSSLSPSPAKRRGRPPKLKTLASEPEQLPKPRNQMAAPSASQPMEIGGWIEIDDIYDSDSPATPSPPRRRATSSPPAVQPLTLSPSIQAKAPAVAAATLKSKDTSWESTRTDLFARITAVVKSAPPSNDGNKPSWYEKILLYDPIVLEDITAWLNQQGLRVEVRKHKPKAKKRGRKRKDPEPEVDEVEWEIHEGPLQAWMVQKWCEDQSICCLWKEGLRGGVRTRY